MSEELKPCPWCASNGERRPGSFCLPFYARCSNAACGAHYCWMMADDWNHRAPDPRVQALVQAGNALALALVAMGDAMGSWSDDEYQTTMDDEPPRYVRQAKDAAEAALAAWRTA